MARSNRIDSAKMPEVYERFAEILPHQPGHYAGTYPQPMAPLLAALMDKLGPDVAGKAEFKRRLEVFRRTGHPTIDELRKLLGFTLEYTEGLLTGWPGAMVAADRTDPDFLAGLADGRAAKETVR